MAFCFVFVLFCFLKRAFLFVYRIPIIVKEFYDNSYLQFQQKKFFAEHDPSKVLQCVEALRKNLGLSGSCVEKMDGTKLVSQLNFFDVSR